MKQNITLTIDKTLLARARVFAAERRISVSALLAEELSRLVENQHTYNRAKTRAMARMEKAYNLGGKRVRDRASLYQ